MRLSKFDSEIILGDVFPVYPISHTQKLSKEKIFYTKNKTLLTLIKWKDRGAMKSKF